MLKMAYDIGFAQALIDAGVPIEELEKVSGVKSFLKNLFGKKLPANEFQKYQQSGRALKDMQRSATETAAYGKHVRRPAEQLAAEKKLLQQQSGRAKKKPATAPATPATPTPEQVAARAQREAAIAQARQRFQATQGA